MRILDKIRNGKRKVNNVKLFSRGRLFFVGVINSYLITVRNEGARWEEDLRSEGSSVKLSFHGGQIFVAVINSMYRLSLNITKDGRTR